MTNNGKKRPKTIWTFLEILPLVLSENDLK